MKAVKTKSKQFPALKLPKFKVDLDFATAQILMEAGKQSGISSNQLMNNCVRRYLDATHAQRDLELLANHLKDNIPGESIELETNIEPKLFSQMEAMASRLARITGDDKAWGVEMIVNAALRTFFRQA